MGKNRLCRLGWHTKRVEHSGMMLVDEHDILIHVKVCSKCLIVLERFGLDVTRQIELQMEGREHEIPR